MGSAYLRECLSTVWARHSLRACASVGRSPRVRGRLWIHGEGEIRVGDGVFFDAASAPIEIYPWAGAIIVFGDDVTIEGGTSIEATESITLGAGTRIGAFCKVMDNHFHPLVGDRRKRPAPQPVVIDEDVTVGPRSIVLAGAHLECNARFGAGSVIRRSASARQAASAR